jgi:hypothetical protein
VGAVALKAKICVNNWAGRRELPCEVLRETETRYVCRMLSEGLLPRGRVDAGDIVEVPKYAVRIETPDHEREIPRQDKTQEESALPQGRGESLVAQLDSALNQAEQLRDQQIQQQYSDQLGIYVQEKAQQIDRLQSSLAASLTSEQAQLQAIQQRAPGWTAGKKTHAQWEQQVARRKTRIAQIALRLDRVGEIEEAAGVYAETKIEELAERKLRLDKPELAQEWDKIQHRERQAAIPKIEQSRSITEELVQTLTLSRTPENK